MMLRILIQPLGARVLGPTDRVVHQCAQMILEPSAARDRLTRVCRMSMMIAALARLEKAFVLVDGRRGHRASGMHAARLQDWEEAVKKGVITQAEGEQAARPRRRPWQRSIEVDDFRAGGAVADLQKRADVHQFFAGAG